MRGPRKRTVRLERLLRGQPTRAETKLWFSLRDRRLAGFKFVRQEALGPYIVDFVCRKKKLIIEVDGGQHADNARDRVRDDALTAAVIAFAFLELGRAEQSRWCFVPDPCRIASSRKLMGQHALSSII